MEIEKKKAKTLILKFNAGEQCFCCSKIFREKKEIKKKFKTEKEYQEYVSSLKFNFGIKINNNK
jgi:hypothetical protein